MGGKEKIYLIALMWLVVLAGVSSGVIYPLYLQVEHFPSLYRDASLRLRELESSVAKYGETKAEFDTITSELPSLKACLVDEKNAVVFIESLENLSRDSKVYSEIKPVGEKADKSKTELPHFGFNLTVVGTFDNVMKFLAQIENFKYAIDVEKVAVTEVKENQLFRSDNSDSKEGFKPDPGDVVLNLIIKAYSNS
jgi:hypothetical protein